MESTRGEPDIALKLSAEDVERFSKLSGLEDFTSPGWISAFLDIVSVSKDADTAVIEWTDDENSESKDNAEMGAKAGIAKPEGVGRIAFTAELNKTLGKGKGDETCPAEDTSKCREKKNAVDKSPA